MTSSLPVEVQQVFGRFVTTEYTTIDGHGQPITWPVRPYYRPDEGCIEVTTGPGDPKKADDAARNPYVGLLFSDPAGCGIERPPMVFVQGTAAVDEWPECDPSAEPQLLDTHMEEVRSGHDEEPEGVPKPPSGRPAVWDSRIDALGTGPYRTAVLSIVAPDGFPFSVRVPVRPDRAAGCIRVDVDALGIPVGPGLACLTAHSRQFSRQRNFQVRGDFVERDGDWVFVPHEYVG